MCCVGEGQHLFLNAHSMSQTHKNAPNTRTHSQVHTCKHIKCIHKHTHTHMFEYAHVKTHRDSHIYTCPLSEEYLVKVQNN